MALVSTRVRPANTTGTLREALSSFEEVLTDNEKHDLRAQGTPDVIDVIKFTVLIDGKSARSRCNASRLVTFLESVQQFTAALSPTTDTLVSSHPDVAGLVWGSVKLSLLVLSTPYM